ncbi:hypothetical protein RJ55_00604 [Drechmeria coniospora]|nr:hypothetical protein RJ55_00604 [Drechmeria coniospora]
MDGSRSPAGGALQVATPDRVNQRRASPISAQRSEGVDSSVLDKISQFNSLSIAMQSKHLERKTADAALRRAMVGREEAEAEIRQTKEEMRLLLKTVQEGKERERRVGERLETVMENYGRAKETHAHTQALWEKEIRRARKENFKTQSSLVKIQEDLKSARCAVKILEESLEREKERSRAREQEAFTARYQIVGVQEQLDQALERIKATEQERDVFKTVAKNEEVARIAAEGRIPLPKTEDPADEFASPRKPTKSTLTMTEGHEGRLSLSTVDIVSSAASEMEIEELTTMVLWERQRADRAQEMVEFLQAECQMHCCPCNKSRKSRSSSGPPQKRRRDSAEDGERSEAISEPDARQAPPAPSATGPFLDVEERGRVKSKKEPRRSTIFCPKGGFFRTVSEQEAEAIEEEQQQVKKEEDEEQGKEYRSECRLLVEADGDLLVPMEAGTGPRMFARTPSVEPPSLALLGQNRTSLQSLLNAPHGGGSLVGDVPAMEDNGGGDKHNADGDDNDDDVSARESPEPRPHTSTNVYTVTMTTTVPVRDENMSMDSSFAERLRTPSHGSNASFDHTNPALTPTMTREEALAKIRERRGRVRSAAQAAATPRKVTNGSANKINKREVSAPSVKTAVVRSR